VTDPPPDLGAAIVALLVALILLLILAQFFVFGTVRFGGPL
jgi:hypothetical protein